MTTPDDSVSWTIPDKETTWTFTFGSSPCRGSAIGTSGPSVIGSGCRSSCGRTGCGSDASILAVIRDETQDLLEDAAKQPCQLGDRMVVAARRDRLAAIVRELAG